MAVAVAVFGNEKIIPDQQGVLHGPGRNVERLEQHGADDDGDDEGVEHHAPDFRYTAFAAFSFSRYAHRPLVFRFRRVTGFRLPMTRHSPARKPKSLGIS